MRANLFAHAQSEFADVMIVAFIVVTLIELSSLTRTTYIKVNLMMLERAS